MKKQIAKLSVLTLCAAAILAMPASSRAQNNANPPVAPTPPVAATPPAVTTPPPAAPKPEVKKRTAPSTLPFRGSVTAVDTNAMTLTVEKRTFNITSETTITKDGKPAVLADGAVGEVVRGAYKKNAEGKLDATTIHFGGAAQTPKKEPTGN